MSKKILNIVTSLNGDASFSSKLSNAVLEQLAVTYPDSEVHTRNLAQEPLPHLDAAKFAAAVTPEDQRTAVHKEAVQPSDTAIREVQDTDIVVIGVPIYNFGIPSTLKAWIDHVSRAGVTFSYTENGFEGQLKNKIVYLAIASGGVFSEGPLQPYDFTENYLRAVLGFLGMTDVRAFRVEGLSVPGPDGSGAETAWAKALESVESFAF